MVKKDKVCDLCEQKTWIVISCIECGDECCDDCIDNFCIQCDRQVCDDCYEDHEDNCEDEPEE